MKHRAGSSVGLEQVGVGPQELSVLGPVVVIDIGAFFFFQAEDGIRDVAVTGVQTCALPI